MDSKQSHFLIVDDHPEIAQSNCEWLQRQIDPQANCVNVHKPNEALNQLQFRVPDLIVVDLLYGKITGEQSADPGLSLLEQIFDKYPELNILVYTSEPNYLMKIVRGIDEHQGGFAVANKIESRERFLDAARSALKGDFSLPQSIRKAMRLTALEQELLILLCKESLTDQAIAARHHISLKTAQNRVNRIKVKLDIDLCEKEVNSRIAACKKAFELKLI